jgi:uncharacterized membrane protein (UPF0127 family)
LNERAISAINITRGRVLARRLEWAGTSETRRRGLLGRDAFQEGAGLYLVPCPWVHTFGMRFPIDLAFLAPDGRVLSTRESLRPNRLSRLVMKAEGVLELPPHTLASTGTRVGDVIQFADAE